MKRILSILFTVVCGLACLQAQTVGLVLSGGGAKGIAHIGIIKALEENNVPIDYVAGTSMGAGCGGVVCYRDTPDEMLDLILSEDFNLWSRGIFDKDTSIILRNPILLPKSLHLMSLYKTRLNSNRISCLIASSIRSL